MIILASEDFVVQSTYHNTKDNCPGHIVIGLDMIIPINLIAYWRYIHQQKQAQIDEDVISEKTNIIKQD